MFQREHIEAGSWLAQLKWCLCHFRFFVFLHLSPSHSFACSRQFSRSRLSEFRKRLGVGLVRPRSKLYSPIALILRLAPSCTECTFSKSRKKLFLEIFHPHTPRLRCCAISLEKCIGRKKNFCSAFGRFPFFTRIIDPSLQVENFSQNISRMGRCLLSCQGITLHVLKLMEIGKLPKKVCFRLLEGNKRAQKKHSSTANLVVWLMWCHDCYFPSSVAHCTTVFPFFLITKWLPRFSIHEAFFPYCLHTRKCSLERRLSRLEPRQEVLLIAIRWHDRGLHLTIGFLDYLARVRKSIYKRQRADIWLSNYTTLTWAGLGACCCFFLCSC